MGETTAIAWTDHTFNPEGKASRAKRYEPHPLALVVPPMQLNEYEELKRDIAGNGLLEPIVLFEDKILDGIHRERACFETNTPLRTQQWKPESETQTPERFVLSTNVRRRHLTTGQRAVFAIELAEELRNRYPRKEGGREGDAEKIWQVVIGNHLPKKNPPKLVVEVTARVVGNVGRSSIARMTTLRKHARNLYDKVASGEMNVAEAYREYKPPAGQIKVTRQLRAQVKRRLDAAVGRVSKQNIIDQWQRELVHMYSLARVTEVMAKRGRLHVTDLIEIASRAERIASDADAIVKLDPSRHLLPEAEANAAEHERNKTTPSASGPPCGGRETDFPSDEEIEHLHNCKIVPGVLPEDAPDWLRVVEKHDRYAGALKVLFDLRKKRPHVPSIRGERKLALRHDDIVVDLGAFVGTFAARCKAFPVKAVRVYEPAPIAAAVCRANGVETIEAAVVGDNSRRVIDFEVSMTGLGCTSALRGYGTERRSFRSIQVPTVSYAEAVKGATVVKVDVEGAEYDYPLVQPSIRAVLLDFHQHATDWRAKAQVMIDDLRAHGFEAIVPPRLDAGKDHLLGSLWIRE